MNNTREYLELMSDFADPVYEVTFKVEHGLIGFPSTYTTEEYRYKQISENRYRRMCIEAARRNESVDLNGIVVREL